MLTRRHLIRRTAASAVALSLGDGLLLAPARAQVAGELGMNIAGSLASMVVTSALGKGFDAIGLGSVWSFLGGPSDNSAAILEQLSKIQTQLDTISSAIAALGDQLRLYMAQSTIQVATGGPIQLLIAKNATLTRLTRELLRAAPSAKSKFLDDIKVQTDALLISGPETWHNAMIGLPGSTGILQAISSLAAASGQPFYGLTAARLTTSLWRYYDAQQALTMAYVIEHYRSSGQDPMDVLETWSLNREEQLAKLRGVAVAEDVFTYGKTSPTPEPPPPPTRMPSQSEIRSTVEAQHQRELKAVYDGAYASYLKQFPGKPDQALSFAAQARKKKLDILFRYREKALSKSFHKSRQNASTAAKSIAANQQQREAEDLLERETHFEMRNGVEFVRTPLSYLPPDTIVHQASRTMWYLRVQAPIVQGGSYATSNCPPTVEVTYTEDPQRTTLIRAHTAINGPTRLLGWQMPNEDQFQTLARACGGSAGGNEDHFVAAMQGKGFIFPPWTVGHVWTWPANEDRSRYVLERKRDYRCPDARVMLGMVKYREGEDPAAPARGPDEPAYAIYCRTLRTDENYW